jgi:murein DD-endopeptidase MepM/ murein hydrolase activator NlpD
MGRPEYFYTNTALRVVFIFSLAVLMDTFGLFPRFNLPVTESSVTGEAGLNAENGMGGMSYYEVPVSAEMAGLAGGHAGEGPAWPPARNPLTIDAALGGVPEPLEYSLPQMLLYSAYTVSPGDTIGEIARDFGLNPDTLISLNSIKNTRLLRIGQVLRIPNQDGILYTVKNGDSLGSIAENYQTDTAAIQTVNELFSEQVNAGSSVFIPGARLEWMDLQEINGDLFIWPVRGYITSRYGYRPDPFNGKVRQFHTGLDIGSPMGTAIKAAMAGRVSAVGSDNVLGNYVVLTHHSGYRTLYAHMSAVGVRTGAYVKTGERIGAVGSTGHSTGPHLHFTVYKNGVTMNPLSLMN